VAPTTQAGEGDLPARSRFGEGRSDHKLSPFEDGSKVASHHNLAAKNGFFDVKEGFLFGGLSPPNKKNHPSASSATLR
jgi:hypothetical protein